MVRTWESGKLLDYGIGGIFEILARMDKICVKMGILKTELKFNPWDVYCYLIKVRPIF